MVSGATIFAIIFEMIFVLALATVMCIVIKKKYKTSLPLFFIGGATFFVFAMILERILHSVVMLTGAMEKLQANIWLYALYGGLAAGIFEEVGRYVVLTVVRSVCVKKNWKAMEKPYNALMFGAGHGGFEAVLLIFSAMINNMLFAVLINTGRTEWLLSQIPEAQQGTYIQAFETLKTAGSYVFYLGCLERVSAVILHIGFSALVWTAVTKKKGLLLPAAILLHALVDGVMVVLSSKGINNFLLEGIILVMALISTAVCLTVWKKSCFSSSASISD